MSGFKHAVIATLALAAFAMPAKAGVLFVTLQTSSDSTKKNETSAHITDTALRIESSNDNEPFIIFRSDKKVVWIVEKKNKTVTEITEEDLEKMATQVKAAQKTMEEQMASMPAAQRAMLERMMKDRMPAMPTPTVYEKTGERKTINGWVGEKYVGTRDGKTEAIVWTASPDQLGVTTDAMGIMKELAAFFREFSDKIGFNFYQVGDEGWEQGYKGIPILTTNYVNDKPGNTYELVEVQEKDFEPALFEMPTGYKKKSLSLDGAFSQPVGK